VGGEDQVALAGVDGEAEHRHRRQGAREAAPRRAGVDARVRAALGAGEEDARVHGVLGDGVRAAVGGEPPGA
jgi:hypothetical protein